MPKQSEVESKAKQREESNRATFDKLIGKPRAEKEVTIRFGGDEEVSMLFKAIGYTDYDKLLSKCPPTTQQKSEGNIYNPNEFGPLLLSEVCVDPQMSVKQWKDIWNSDEWSKGEITQIFVIAGELCSKGLDIPK